MKKNTSSKIRLGIFTSLGIAVFILGIYFIGERQQLFRSTFRVIGVFKDVAGLQAGSNVRFSGVNVGTVDNIRIVSDSSVRVEILIDESTRKFIRKDAFASIGSEGLMGNKILIIIPGTGGKKEIENNDIVETVQPINMDDIMISLKSTIDNSSNITSSLSKITSNIQSGKGTIGRLLMDRSLEQNFDSSIVNLKQGLSGLKNLVDNAKSSFAQNFDSTFVNLKEGSAGFRILIDKAKKSWLLWGF
jgi:phospholipid/cholesterol/gamma-HCH transport system substrate-binding protein